VTVTNAYDGENNLRFRTTILESGSFHEEFQYDALSYATNHIDALGNPEGSTVGLDGRVLQLRDKEGEVVTNSYTVLGEKLGESDPNGVRIEFSYDVNRKLAAVSDARGQSARNSFDFAGRLTGETLPDDAVNSYTNFTLLTAPSSATLPRNISVSLKYDVMGNVTNRLITGPADTRAETYFYDGLQRAKRIQDPNGFVEFDYNLLGPWKQMRQGYTSSATRHRPRSCSFRWRPL
jgi:YD repeat-containing protein